jgi:hypothetical protein
MEKLFDNPKENKTHEMGNGIHRIYEFENGYGASIVRFKIRYGSLGSYGSYTSNEQEWELAVLYQGHLCYDTPITDDVMGHLLEDDVEKILEQIKNLPSKENK